MTLDELIGQLTRMRDSYSGDLEVIYEANECRGTYGVDKVSLVYLYDSRGTVQLEQE